MENFVDVDNDKPYGTTYFNNNVKYILFNTPNYLFIIIKVTGLN